MTRKSIEIYYEKERSFAFHLDETEAGAIKDTLLSGKIAYLSMPYTPRVRETDPHGAIGYKDGKPGTKEYWIVPYGMTAIEIKDIE